MLNPFIDLFSTVIWLYSWCIIASVVIEILVSFKIINAFQPAVQKLRYALNRLSDPALRPIRKRLPDMGGIDISPVVLLLLLQFANNVMRHYFYNL